MKNGDNLPVAKLNASTKTCLAQISLALNYLSHSPNEGVGSYVFDGVSM